jgi:hypothetical protein
LRTTTAGCGGRAISLISDTCPARPPSSIGQIIYVEWSIVGSIGPQAAHELRCPLRELARLHPCPQLLVAVLDNGRTVTPDLVRQFFAPTCIFPALFLNYLRANFFNGAAVNGSSRRIFHRKHGFCRVNLLARRPYLAHHCRAQEFEAVALEFDRN